MPARRFDGEPGAPPRADEQALSLHRSGHKVLRVDATTMRGMRRFPFEARPRDAPVSRRPAVAYALAWLVAVALAVGVVFAIFGGGSDDVALPPVRATQLEQAAVRGRCELQRPRPGRPLNPPVEGAPGARPAAAGVYEEPVATASLIAAQRKGIVVIQFREGLGNDVKKRLEKLQAAVPKGTIVAPNGTGMQFEIAVTAYRRLLGCPRFTTQMLDAVRLFRGRYLGSGPDATGS
jgi:hypothetical protein